MDVLSWFQGTPAEVTFLGTVEAVNALFNLVQLAILVALLKWVRGN